MSGGTPTRSRTQQSRTRSRTTRPPQRGGSSRGSGRGNDESPLVSAAKITLGVTLSCSLGGLLLLALLGVIALGYYLIG